MTRFEERDLPKDGLLVTEEVVQMAATICGPESTFQKALDIGQEYKDAGLTPIYITDYDHKMIWVTYEEGLLEDFH